MQSNDDHEETNKHCNSIDDGVTELSSEIETKDEEDKHSQEFDIDEYIISKYNDNNARNEYSEIEKCYSDNNGKIHIRRENIQHFGDLFVVSFNLSSHGLGNIEIKINKSIIMDKNTMKGVWEKFQGIYQSILTANSNGVGNDLSKKNDCIFYQKSRRIFIPERKKVDVIEYIYLVGFPIIEWSKRRNVRSNSEYILNVCPNNTKDHFCIKHTYWLEKSHYNKTLGIHHKINEVVLKDNMNKYLGGDEPRGNKSRDFIPELLRSSVKKMKYTR